MTHAMLFATICLAVFLIGLPLHEEVTLIQEVSIVGMVGACAMIHLRCARSVLFEAPHANPQITMVEILERHPEYKYPRNSHRI